MATAVEVQTKGRKALQAVGGVFWRGGPSIRSSRSPQGEI